MENIEIIINFNDYEINNDNELINHEIKIYKRNDDLICKSCNKHKLYSQCHQHNQELKERYKMYHQQDKYKNHRRNKKYCETCQKYISISNYWRHVKSPKHINNQHELIQIQQTN